MFMLDKSPIPCCFIVRGSRSFRCFYAFSAQKPREFFPFFYLLSHHEILPPCSASETSLTFSVLRAVSVPRARIFTFLHTRPTNLPLISFFQQEFLRSGQWFCRILFENFLPASFSVHQTLIFCEPSFLHLFITDIFIRNIFLQCRYEFQQIP